MFSRNIYFVVYFGGYHKIAWVWQLSHLHLSVEAVSLLCVIGVRCNLY